MARAIVYNHYGTNLKLMENEVPEPTHGHVVVQTTIRPVLPVDLYFSHQVFREVLQPIVLGYAGFEIVHSV